MKRCIVGGLAALLMAAELIASAPPASAGCQYGGLVISKCDGPVQPDGTWQRCMVYDDTSGSNHRRIHRCFLMGPGQNPPLGVIFNSYPDHIDD